MTANATREAYMAKEDTTEMPAPDFFDELEHDLARVGAAMHPLALPACILLGTTLGLLVLNVGH